MSDSPALIFDIGGSSIRAGISTSKEPTFVINTAFPIDDIDFPITRELKMEHKIDYVIQRGEFTNEDRMNFIFASVFSHFFPEDQPEPTNMRFVITDHPQTSNKHTKYLLETAYELMSADSVLMKPPALFSSVGCTADQTCLCVDVGHSITYIIPLIDGYVASNSITRSFAAGAALDMFTSSFQLGYSVVDTWEKATKVTKLKHQYSHTELNYDDIQNEDDSLLLYGAACGEMLFNPPMFEAAIINNEEEEEEEEGASNDKNAQKLQEIVSDLIEEEPIYRLISNCIEQCDISSRSKLWKNIILTGGTTKMKGFVERLNKELNRVSPSTITPKIIVPEDPILACYHGEVTSASIDSGHSWISLDEYEEDPEGVARRFKTYGFLNEE